MMLSHGAGEKGADTILESDPFGLTVAMISISVVLSALIVLGLLIWGFSSAMIFNEQRQAEKIRKSASKNPNAPVPDVEEDLNGEVIAAISYALRLHKEELHDHESKVITINSVARAYSPWSSKIHGLTNMPR